MILKCFKQAGFLKTTNKFDSEDKLLVVEWVKYKLRTIEPPFLMKYSER